MHFVTECTQEFLQSAVSTLWMLFHTSLTMILNFIRFFEKPYDEAVIMFSMRTVTDYSRTFTNLISFIMLVLIGTFWNSIEKYRTR